MADLSHLRSPTVEAIDRAYTEDQRRAKALRLSPGDLANECERAVQYKFRWAYEPEAFTGAMLRMFSSMKIAELGIITGLKRAGLTVYDLDEASGRGFSATAVGGHLYAKIDAVASRVPEAPAKMHFVKAKSFKEKSFRALKKDGVAAARPDHYALSQVVMHAEGLERTLYIGHNRNDDELFVERIRYDVLDATKLMAKAERIVTEPQLLPKSHDDPKSKAAFACGYCPARHVCHSGAWAPRNCRTCLHSTPALDGNGRWYCERHNVDLSREDQESGCASHLYIPDLVPGRQIDASSAEEWVDYEIADGEIWRDGGNDEGLAAPKGVFAAADLADTEASFEDEFDDEVPF